MGTDCPKPAQNVSQKVSKPLAGEISLRGAAAPLLSIICLSSRSYNPFDGPNENPEAELPLTAGKYLYVYGDMDEDGFYEGISRFIPEFMLIHAD